MALTEPYLSMVVDDKSGMLSLILQNEEVWFILQNFIIRSLIRTMPYQTRFLFLSCVCTKILDIV